MRLWKLLGLAGVAGVAASGAAAVRAQRRREALSPDEVRARLHQRLAEATGAQQDRPAEIAAPADPEKPRWVRRPWWPRSQA